LGHLTDMGASHLPDDTLVRGNLKDMGACLVTGISGIPVTDKRIAIFKALYAREDTDVYIGDI